MNQVKITIMQSWDAIARLYLRYFGSEAEFRTFAVVVVVLAILWVIYKILSRGIRKYMVMRAHKQDNIQNFMLMWRYAWMGIFVLFLLVSFSGSIATLGISAAFLGMILGWSLQSPVTGIAAWLMIILKRPFRIGDRIIISGITGDVVDITLTHILLNQVGGTIGGEERSGRTVLIPNATLFQQIIHNYTFGTRYLLDEVIVTITFGSDFKKAERILIRAASKVTKNVTDITNEKPFVRVEISESGVRLRLRYKSLAKLRQETSSDIVKLIIAMFNREDEVEFAYPHSEVVYRAKGGSDSVPPMMQAGPVQNTPVQASAQAEEYTPPPKED
ncbi:MAG: hypothetical protein AUJ34_00015 [Parcubacteria group bacterium CG1_02_41_12]|nr:MAG: hypothetical protein AUJ34_00015 [Parcubacteria group bacterium CG1_02_41_12]